VFWVGSLFPLLRARGKEKKKEVRDSCGGRGGGNGVSQGGSGGGQLLPRGERRAPRGRGKSEEEGGGEGNGPTLSFRKESTTAKDAGVEDPPISRRRRTPLTAPV